MFDSPTNLHYSQTCPEASSSPLRFDSPTNLRCSQTGILLFILCDLFDSPTNLHCSQTQGRTVPSARCLIPLRICTALKPCCSQCPDDCSLIPLRICTALKPQMFEINDLRITCAISQVVFTHPYTNTKYRNLHPQYVYIPIQELDVRYFPVSISVYLFLLYSAEINSSLHQKDNSANLPE